MNEETEEVQQWNTVKSCNSTDCLWGLLTSSSTGVHSVNLPLAAVLCKALCNSRTTLIKHQLIKQPCRLLRSPSPPEHWPHNTAHWPQSIPAHYSRHPSLSWGFLGGKPRRNGCWHWTGPQWKRPSSFLFFLHRFQLFTPLYNLCTSTYYSYFSNPGFINWCCNAQK